MLHLLGIFEIVIILIINIAIGTIGFRYTENMGWLDSMTDTCLIISTMGPRYYAKTTGGKIFTSVFSLYSGLIFIVIFGVLFNKLIFSKINF